MSSKIVRLCLLLGAVVLLLGAVALPASAASSARAKVRLGALLYADTALSSPDG